MKNGREVAAATNGWVELPTAHWHFRHTMPRMVFFFSSQFFARGFHIVRAAGPPHNLSFHCLLGRKPGMNNRNLPGPSSDQIPAGRERGIGNVS